MATTPKSWSMALPTPTLPQPTPKFLLHHLAIFFLSIKSLSQRLMPAFLASTFSKIPIRSAIDLSDEVECVVCLCSIEKGERIRDLKCQHLFHKLCLDRWLEHRGRTCPICRDHLYLVKEAKRGSKLEVIHGEVDTIIISPFGDSGHEDTWWIR
ncbi:putative E3 ubiquitin-protein ligase RHA2B [Cocos nucifera]|uniref:Putative E3 ubiquitin-protein ligase RHA2B n=1 Tax=Cocos nucifera TaxID=13894 RepID=A0A8K0N058_COCNU|nr:putative E3 ubiquitin-protein ligase RHA2B [Cocos nucifera]